MIFILTNIFAFLGISILLYIGILLDYKNLKKINILIITITSLLISLSVILTNLISYSIPIFKGVKLSLGNFLIFVIGMLFGPFFGILSGIATDTIGVLINISGTYHIGFAFNLALYGFFGSMVFVFKNKKTWILKVIILYIISFILIVFLFNTLWLYSIGWNKFILKITIFVKIIKFLIQILIYLPILIFSFIILYKLIINHNNINLWCTQKGMLMFTTIKFKKNKKKYNC